MIPDRFRRHALIVTLTLLSCHSQAAAPPAKPAPTNPDLAIGQALQHRIEGGKGVWLDADGQRFFAILSEDQSGKLQGGAILLPDAGAHPDWPEVIRPLRLALSRHGWTTLAIQLPTVDSHDHYPRLLDKAPARIRKAVEQFRSRGINNIVLIGHGAGAMAGAAYLAGNSDSGINAFVGISLSALRHKDEQLYTPKLLERIRLPILDIFGGQDLPTVVNTAEQRALAAKKASEDAYREKQVDAFRRSGMATEPLNKIRGYIMYRQVKLSGADHGYTAYTTPLVKRILGWLDRHASGTTMNTGEP